MSKLENWLIKKNIRLIFGSIAITIAVVTFYMYNLYHPLFVIGFPISILIFIYGMYLHVNLSQKKLLIQIRNQWGKPLNIKRNMAEIKEAYSSLNLKNKSCYRIDDQTWNDLLMDEIYAAVDSTQTTCGQVVLYNILRNPIFEYPVWDQRKKAIYAFHKDIDFREKLQVILHKLGKQNKEEVENLLTDDLPSPPKFLVLLEIVPYINLISIIASIILVRQKKIELFLIPLLVITVLSIINGIVREKLKRGVMSHSTSIGYLTAIINTAKRIVPLSANGLEYQLNELTKAYNACKIINRKTFALNMEQVDPFGLYSYINILFLIDVRMFFRAINDIRKLKEELINLYALIGELDALSSIASFRDRYTNTKEPELDNQDVRLEVDNIVHPLMEKAIANSISLNEKGALITGSNMSGKSTFLRTIGINAVLAQTVCITFATRYKSSFFKVSTSISQGDNLLGGKSYFLAEAETLLKMLKGIQTDLPTICIIDEIFRGTNSKERIAAASQLLKYISKLNAITIVATHDIELTDLVKNEYDVYYFDENVGSEGLIFDYHLRKGIAPSRNAVKILDYIGYPKEIIEKSREMVNRQHSIID